MSEQGSDLNAAATATAGNPATATITPQATQIAYLDGFVVTCNPATVTSGDVTVTGLIGGTQTFRFSTIAGQAAQLRCFFTRPVRASAIGQAIAVTCPALTGSAVAVNVFGHQE